MRLGMGMEQSAPMIMDGEAMSSAYLSLALTAVDAEIADATASGSGRLTEAIIAVAQNMALLLTTVAGYSICAVRSAIVWRLDSLRYVMLRYVMRGVCHERIACLNR